MSTKVSAADSSSQAAGNSISAAITPSGPSNGLTPPRRLRTRTSTNGNDLSQKKNLSNSLTEKVHYASDSNSNGNNNSVSSTCDDKLPSNKRYHSSCPQLCLTGRKDRNHSQPHSSSSFDMNKTEEFHFDTPLECPVFRPTLEEFKNPLAYISKIRPIAEKCGIAKILPPESWSPPFAVDVDKLKFTPRVQRLNELEAKTRVKLNFLDQIAKFWELQGSSLKIPMVERKALDLYSLHRIVQEEGGIEHTTKDRKWAKVANRMSYPTSKSVGATLKAHYERILHPFEVYTSGKVLGSSVTSNAEVKLEDGTDYKTHEIPTRQQIAPPNENSARRSKRFANSNASCGLGANKSIKIESKEDFKRDLLNSFNTSASGGSPNSKSGTQTTVTSSSSGKKVTPDNAAMIDPLMKYICHICNRGDVEESMLLCDGCDDSYHTFCLLPPLSSIPKGEWLCPRCVVEEVSKPTEAFGFEQAEREYTLQQFGQMADQFKMDYFRKQVHLVPTDLVEREFWRIVSSIDEDVTVEYGADLHTMDHGSGFPTKSSLYLLPGDQEYAESSWNLNNLPLLEDSILGHINADISGMNAPWMYVGMCFAAFCWHIEDHWSYSINYLHWGEPKTWYGVPGGCAEQFEETMKQAAPELFASQPDLLHQLVTIMNPNILMNNGVPVYRTDQNAGEFVITFPRAYHAGFNQGYNFAEAVNFAPADWLKLGRECINHYSTLRRFCVFSHDELVCKMALEPAKLTFGIATACYIDMVEMVDSEKKLRKSLLDWGVTRAERKAFELIPDDERHCQECNTTCFLSAVACECTKTIVCLRHYTVLCSCPPQKHTLLYRYTLDEMPLMLQKVKVKTQTFERWLSRCRDIVDINTPASVTLQELQELCKEAEVKNFPSSLLIDRLNAGVVEAEKCVTVIQQLGINKVRTRSDNNNEAAQYKLTMEELELFVQEIDNLCCIIEEGASVRELLSLGKQFVERSNEMLKRRLDDLSESELENLISEGNSLRIELDEMHHLNVRLKQLKWYKQSQALRNGSSKISYEDIKQLLYIAAADVVPTDVIIDTEIRKLQEIGASIEAWEHQAKKYFTNILKSHQLNEIERFLKTTAQIEGQVPSYLPLKDALRKARDWLKSVVQATSDQSTYCHKLEVIVSRGNQMPIKLEELNHIQESLKCAHQWKENAKNTFLKKNTFYTLLEVLMPRTEPVIIDSDLKKPFNDDIIKGMNPVQIVDSYKMAEGKELQDMRNLRRLNLEKNPFKDSYCLCKSSFHGMMYNCQLCKDWFHEECVAAAAPSSSPLASPSPSPSTALPAQSPLAVPSPLMKTMSGCNDDTKQLDDNKTKWLCPSCVRTKRPRLETMLPLLVSLRSLPIRLLEDEALRCLAERAMSWQDRARKALINPNITRALDACAAVPVSVAECKDNIEKVENTENKANAENAEGAVNTPAKLTKTPDIPAESTGINNPDSDDEGRLHIVEDHVTNEEKNTMEPISTTCGNAEQNPNGAVGSVIQLSESEIESLEDLLMEGDLIEVSLEETNDIRRTLSTLQPSPVSEAATLVKQYQLQQSQQQQAAQSSNANSAAEDSNDSLIVQGSPNANGATANSIMSNRSTTNSVVKKRRSLDPSTGCPLPRKKLNSSASAGNKQTTPSNASVPSTTSNKKYSRKLDLSKQQFDDKTNNQHPTKQHGNVANISPAGNNSNNTISSSTNGVPNKKQRKRMGTAGGHHNNHSNSSSGQKKASQRAQMTQQDDDEEECRAENCHKPTGREVDWVQCDGGCNEWFHMFCVGLNRNQIKADDDYICIRCSKSMSNVTMLANTGAAQSPVSTSTAALPLASTTPAAAAPTTALIHTTSTSTSSTSASLTSSLISSSPTVATAADVTTVTTASGNINAQQKGRSQLAR